MARRHITKQQVKLYMNYREERGLTQEAAAAKAGLSVRTARTIEHGKHRLQRGPKPRHYKTRTSSLDKVWESELIPLLEKDPELQAKTLFLYLERTHQNELGEPIYPETLLRTLQRRVSIWKALHGKEKEVMFPQEHLPGQQGLSDFTHFNEVEIRIAGEVFKHMFYHFRLVYSKWSYLKVIQSGESFQALSEGLQEALFHLGGAPFDHRTDSLSAAFKNLSAEAKLDLTRQYEWLCEYYSMKPTRNNKGKKHENGSVESSHGHLKNRIAQELILRGSNEFKSVADYEEWIHKMVQAANQRNSRQFELEKQNLQPLPIRKSMDYEIKSVKVTGLSLLLVKGMRYSVPSQLSGHTLTFHIYQHTLSGYLGSTLVFTSPRKYKEQHRSCYVIDYRHVIHALIKKPGAFRYCKYRDEIFPNESYRTIWQHIDETQPRQTSAKMMLRILKLAADYQCEETLAVYLIELIHHQQPFNIEAIENKFNTHNPPLPLIECKQHVLTQYDQFIQEPSTHLTQITGETHATL
jgi:transcriptional regulator with XRE-family HTH domain